MRRATVAAIVVVLLAVCDGAAPVAVIGGVLVRARPNAPASPVEPAVVIKVLSWNVHGLPWPFSLRRTARLERIADRIREERPDVVALQEAWTASTLLLTSELGDYTPAYPPDYDGWSRGGLLILVRNDGPWSLDDVEPTFYPYPVAGSPLKLWQADGISGKGALVASLVRGDGARIWIVDTHLQSQYRCDKYVDVRMEQLMSLRERIDDLGTAAPVLVAGDFNTFPKESELYALMGTLGTDVTVDAQVGDTHTNYATDGTEGWIDYVLLRARAGNGATGRPRLVLNDASDDPFSDHHGLFVEVVETRGP